VKTDQLSDIKETSFSLNVLWNKMLDRQRLFGLNYPGKWCDVGHPEGIEMAETILRSANV
jgi:MurNAc alpha-1-phosphate uridylyltransferase